MTNPAVDVLVIGGGPGGLVAAEGFARRGLRTILCEEHDTIGTPVHCTGILSIESFDEFGLPTASRLNALFGARFVSPSGITVGYRTPSPLATVIDRAHFDLALADRVRAAGVIIRTGLRVSNVETNATEAIAVAGDELLRARLLVLACGANYTFQRRLGLGFPRAYLHTAQREVPAQHAGDVELHFGRAVAADGFSWAVPVIRGEKTFARIGVMTSDDAQRCYARMLARIGSRWGIVDDGQLPRQKVLPLGTIDRTFAERLLVVGDAAGIVKPTTGGGIYYSVMSGSLAAEIGADALHRERLDAASLSRYERAWRAQLDEEFDAQHALRSVVSRMTDVEIDALFELARTDGILPIVRKTIRFNRHRDLIHALFRHPPARKLLFRTLAG
jgi:digeranylgeranylglycerophospholipid reductase